MVRFRHAHLAAPVVWSSQPGVRAPAPVARRRSPASLKKQEAQAKVVALVAQGRTVKDAVASVGRTKRAYELWRAKDPSFALKMDMVRLGTKEGGVQGIDFVKFRSTFFDRNTPIHHLGMIQEIEKAKADSVTLILAPPEHAKTSLMVDYICWKLAENPNFRVAVVSEGADLAEKILGQIATRMTDDSVATNRRYIETYGPFKAPDRAVAKPWNTRRITLLRARHDEKEPSVEARGAGSRIYGSRYDLVIFDDIQSSESLNDTPKLLRYFRQTAMTRVARDIGKTIIVGTRVGPGDFYETILAEEGLVDRLVKMPAVTVDDDGREHALWPEEWPLEKLHRRRIKVGPEIWARVYQQEPVSMHSATFTDAMIDKACDAGRSVGGPIPGTGVLCALDPALSGDSGFLAVAYNAERLWVLDAEVHTDIPRVEDMLNIIERFSAAYRPNGWQIEKNIGRATARDDRLMAMAANYGFEVREPVTTGRNKYEPVAGIGAMASIFARGEISIPYGDDASRDKMRRLCRELREWRPNVPGRLLSQDLIICLWMIWKEWVSWRDSMTPTVSVPQFRPSWLVA